MQRRGERAFSLIEVMIVMAVAGLLMGGAVYGVRSLARTELRGSASKLAAAIRYCFDRAITTGAYYRIVLDLEGNKYWAERSDERAFLSRDKEKTLGRGHAFDRDAEEKRQDEDDAKAAEALASKNALGAQLDPPPKPKRARFQTFKDATLPAIQLKRVQLFDVYTPRQPEPYTQGRAYLYFFPDGHTERALIRLKDGDAWYSLVVHPLTAQVEVKSEKVELSRDFDAPREVAR